MAFVVIEKARQIVKDKENTWPAKAVIGLYYFLYWFYHYLANMTGHIPIHTVRHLLYVRLFRLKIKDDSIIYSGCRFYEPGRVTVGHRSIIGYDAFLDARQGIDIGQNVNIGGEVAIFTAEHDIASPSFSGKGGPVIIHDWAYVGTRAMILPGVTLGEGAVVASGAVVTKDVKPWTMVGGVPARYIKDRPVVKYSLDTDSIAHFM